MNLLPISTDFSGMDCHVHSTFSPDACAAGADSPQGIADAVRKKGLRGFIVTDHIDVGHWNGCKPIDFDEYFTTWERVRRDNPDLTIYIGIEAGFERHTAEQTAKLLNDLPFEYVINSVHYWAHNCKWADGRNAVYSEYLDCVLASLDAPYPFTTVGHIGFPERYAPYPQNERALEYKAFKPIMDAIIEKAVARGILLEENTNASGEMRQPRADFLHAYKAAGGRRPVLGSDAHTSDKLGQYFAQATSFLDGIFGA